MPDKEPNKQNPLNPETPTLNEKTITPPIAPALSVTEENRVFTIVANGITLTLDIDQATYIESRLHSRLVELKQQELLGPNPDGADDFMMRM